MNKAVFFDRDGVLIESVIRDNKPFSARTIEELTLTKGVVETIESVKKLGFKTYMITNQPDISRGFLKQENLDQMNSFLKEKLGLDDCRVCPHDDSDNCNCRKPKAGMILDLAELYDIDLESSFVIGDRWKDIDAGEKANCKTIFINLGYDEKVPDNATFECNQIQEILTYL